MLNLNSFFIEFNRPDAIYTPGDIVEGNVIIDLVNEKTIKGKLKLQATGDTFFKWSGEKTIMPSPDYWGRETYLSLTYSLLENTEGDKKVHFPAGLNKYSFRVPLPHNIPCSFKHTIGRISYRIRAIIDSLWMPTYECEAAFTVFTTYDLNNYREQCIGINDEVNETFYCFCFNSGLMNVHIRVPKTGFVPGECIESTFNLRNISNINVTSLCAKLVQFIEFHANTTVGLPTEKTFEETVVSVEKAGPFNENSITLLRLHIPAILPSELQFCTIINLKYALQISLQVSGMHYNVYRMYPILIGTVPLQPVFAGI